MHRISWTWRTAKLREGGILALVLPFTFTQGASWANARALIKKYYDDILLVSIASDGGDDRAFSADTGMAEVLLLAKRKESEDKGTGDIVVVNLLRRPRTQVEAVAMARTVKRCRLSKKDAAGAFRVTATQEAGNFFRSGGWVGVGVTRVALAIFMQSLAQGTLLLPRMRDAVPIPVCRLEKLGRRGYLSRDINGVASSGQARGPLDIAPLTPPPEYPVLWTHEAKREREMIVLPDAQGRSRAGCRKRAAQLWHSGTSRLHFTVEFQLNSQPLAACLTENPTLGGRAWPNFLTRKRWEIPILLWANTTLGVMAFWWAGTRQQLGRSVLSLSRMSELLSMDAAKLTEGQLSASEKIFDDFRGQQCLPANEAYRDDVRKALDRAVLLDLLGLDRDILDSLAVLRDQWVCRTQCARRQIYQAGGPRMARRTSGRQESRFTVAPA